MRGPLSMMTEFCYSLPIWSIKYNNNNINNSNNNNNDNSSSSSSNSIQIPITMSGVSIFNSILKQGYGNITV